MMIDVFNRDENFYEHYDSKFFLNDIKMENVIKVDTERGYLDYYPKYNGNYLVFSDNILSHRVFGKVEIRQ